MNSTLTEDNLKYNFVFLFAGEDYYRAILGQEIYHSEKTRVYRTAFDGSAFLQKLFHYHWAYNLNEKIRMPFKRLWFKRMYTQDFKNDLPLCFVFVGGNNARFDAGFCEHVRKKDPRNKVVFLHQDLISKKCDDYEAIRKKADLCITYDKDEAEKYEIEYLRDTYYSKLILEPEKVDFKYDVYFLGAAKDRLEKIHDIYNYLTSQGLLCKFVVVGVAKDRQIEGIEYSHGISYEKNLENVVKSRCVLEITQKGSSDISLRTLEAIAYRRKLITDCPANLTECFNEKQLYQFNNIQDIDVDSLKKEFKVEEFNPKIDLNPLKRLYNIQEKLEKIDECQS